ncbi:MAG: exodeoxyribonuclease VII small subunit [Opitutae bacterium]|nr:exodeoxyribonuclease VII small subunit [Opitutae bacterium]
MNRMVEEKTDETGTEEDTEVSFEDALSQLEDVIHRMETGESPLESLVENYQSGVRLLKLCRSKIELAEMKVKEVTDKDGKLESRDFTQAEE